MSKKIDVRSILKKYHLGLSTNKIAKSCHVSRHSIKPVLDRCRDLELDLDKLDMYSDEYHPITREMIANLSTCNYLLSHHDIGIEEACGSGKTCPACALANAAIKQKKGVLYIRFPELLEKFHVGIKTGKEVSAIVKKYVKFDLMIPNEFLMY